MLFTRCYPWQPGANVGGRRQALFVLVLLGQFEIECALLLGCDGDGAKGGEAFQAIIDQVLVSA